jgi:V/A-type H+-transporting ATPase subunit C
MILPASQAYLRTRLSILHQRLKKPEDIESLIQLPADRLLAQFHIEPGGKASNSLLMQQFEQKMLQVWLDEIAALLRPLKGPARAILVQWARRYELYNIKALVRGKLAGLSRARIAESLFRLPGFLDLDLEPLLHSDSLPELLRRLDGTPYQSIARQAQRRFTENPDPFLLDAALDQFFYIELCRHLEPLEPTDRREMRELLGRVIDRHNLVWMLRYRYNYALSPAQSLYLSIEQGHLLDRPALARLVNQPDIPGFLAALPEPIGSITGSEPDIVIIESRLQADLKASSEQAFQHSPSILAVALGYLNLRYFELSLLYAILQARLLGLGDALLREALQPKLRSAA